MYERTVLVANSAGLHARPAQQLVMRAKQFQSKILIRKEEETEGANVKSIIALLSKSVGPGSRVAISAEGEDEIQAVDALVDLIESGFGEA